MRSPRKCSNSALFRHPALQRRAAHCGLHSCRCKAGVHVYVGRAGPSEQFVRGHHHPAVPQAGLRELPQIPAGAGAGCHGAAGDRPAHPGGRAGRAASGALLDIQANREEELRATIQAIDTRQLRRVLSLLRSCEVIEVVSEGRSLPVALDASIRFGHLGKRCVASALHEKTLAFAQTLTPKDLLMAFSTSGRDAGLEEVISAAKVRGAPVLLITCDSHSPLAHLSDYVMTASNREQRLIEGSHAASLLSPNILVEVLYYLLRMEKA